MRPKASKRLTCKARTATEWLTDGTGCWPPRTMCEISTRPGNNRAKLANRTGKRRGLGRRTANTHHFIGLLEIVDEQDVIEPTLPANGRRAFDRLWPKRSGSEQRQDERASNHDQIRRPNSEAKRAEESVNYSAPQKSALSDRRSPTSTLDAPGIREC